MSHCDDHRKQKYECYFFQEHPNVPQIWNIQIYGSMERTFMSMDVWTEYSNIRIYGGKICTYKCAPNQEHTNQWFNGWNIVMHRYMAQSLEHIDVQQKVTLKNMVSRMEYLNIHIYGFTFWNVDL
ncbi:predicted protein [Candida tropicalis MYA-3404]|uniref:Uncharacterized protein n=1 Tax=Candida tropicalis (strain ATCC MYA-3404 / T1) TaxID=294747 RepID=C5MHJ0_CANTT|nr:predicted protein [Candida tropicalis MYA-3404]EER31092.1 predicted protein [Candida tropicalis MYA-3404]KAG4404654.1 hypothetical protein JTP64_006407 [Candida tropicalis]